jgi:hypothetical protein
LSMLLLKAGRYPNLFSIVGRLVILLCRNSWRRDFV